MRFNKIKRIRCFCCVVLLAHVVWTKKREESNRLTVQSMRRIKKGKEEKREEKSSLSPVRIRTPRVYYCRAPCAVCNASANYHRLFNVHCCCYSLPCGGRPTRPMAVVFYYDLWKVFPSPCLSRAADVRRRREGPRGGWREGGNPFVPQSNDISPNHSARPSLPNRWWWRCAVRLGAECTDKKKIDPRREVQCSGKAKELSCADSDTMTIDALKKGERGEERKVSKKEEKEHSSIDGRGLGASWAFHCRRRL